MAVLVDSSVWIEYFRKGRQSDKLDYLIDENIVVTNELILTELIPFLLFEKQTKVIHLLRSISQTSLNIIWDQIIDLQARCLKNGINKVGIPDLIIVQNAMQNGNQVYSLDNHFGFISKITPLKLF
jgi:predicted nucleic acid-binding protein